MAIDLAPVTQTIKSQRRTRYIEIQIPYGNLPTLRAHREIVNLDVAGVVLSKGDAKAIERSMAKVILESFTLKSGVVVTINQISEGLAGLIDRWETEDMAPKV